MDLLKVSLIYSLYVSYVGFHVKTHIRLVLQKNFFRFLHDLCEIYTPGNSHFHSHFPAAKSEAVMCSH